MAAIALSALEREIIDDILAVCRRCGWPADVRPSLHAFLQIAGYAHLQPIDALGGWDALCARAGMVSPRVLPPGDTAGPSGAPADFDTVLADIRRVAEGLNPRPGYPRTPTRQQYLQSGGKFSESAIVRAGGWKLLSAAAGVSLRRGRKPALRSTAPHPPTPDSARAGDAALDPARTPRPEQTAEQTPEQTTGTIQSTSRRVTLAKPVHRDVPVVQRGEIIADIRDVSMSLGCSPRAC